MHTNSVLCRLFADLVQTLSRVTVFHCYAAARPAGAHRPFRWWPLRPSRAKQRRQQPPPSRAKRRRRWRRLGAPPLRPPPAAAGRRPFERCGGGCRRHHNFRGRSAAVSRHRRHRLRGLQDEGGGGSSLAGRQRRADSDMRRGVRRRGIGRGEGAGFRCASSRRGEREGAGRASRAKVRWHA
jgi:hypothetical protein